MKKGISLTSLDLDKVCENHFEFEYLDPNGKGTGVYLSVIGGHSQKVRQYSINEINRLREQESIKARIARKRNKNAVTDDYTPIEDDIEYAIKDAAIRLVGWRGIDDEFNATNADILCRTNQLARQQIMEASSEIGNFTKSK